MYRMFFCIISPKAVAVGVKCMKLTEARPIVSATKNVVHYSAFAA